MYLYNSATHKKEEFKTHTPGHVEMYTCGPTVYHFAHIGNLRSYIMEDVLEKYLRYAGYSVNRVMNITDVGHLTSDADEGEDKMLKGARREHKTVMEIAQYYTDAFFEDCRKLDADLLLLIRRKYINNSVDGFVRSDRMQCRKYEMSCLCCCHGGTDSFCISHFSQQDHIRCLSQAGPQPS